MPDGKPVFDEVQAEYDALASRYDAQWRKYIEATLRAVEEVVECDAHATVLDVPCGTGELERRLLARWPQVQIVGIDLSQAMLKQATRKGVPKTAHWLRADVCHLPLAEDRFDWVICANSFHYFQSPAAALRAMRKALRPGGRLVLLDWCDDYLLCKACGLWLRWTGRPLHRTYSSRRCRAMLQREGFAVQAEHRFRVGWVWGMMRFFCTRPA